MPVQNVDTGQFNFRKRIKNTAEMSGNKKALIIEEERGLFLSWYLKIKVGISGKIQRPDIVSVSKLIIVIARAPARWVVVLLHGGGQKPQNMLSLAQNLQPYLPDAAFEMPFGPYPRNNGGVAGSQPA
jgi:hypothetical protein